MATSLKTTSNPEALARRYRAVRSFTEQLVAPLSPEDCAVQSMEDVSPTRWHLAHTSWFFEIFVLSAALDDYRSANEEFCYLFNSYYNAIGEQYPRAQRGLISRPGLQSIKEYRAHVDEQMDRIFASGELKSEIAMAIEVGLQHEQQHQELILTDIKHVLSHNPTLPSYQVTEFAACQEPSWAPEDSRAWCSFDAGIYEFGHDGNGFAFDNEWPQHEALLHPFSLAADTVTCGEFIEFIEDGGYQRPEHWLSLGWNTVKQQKWSTPLYWFQRDGQWMVFTLAGPIPVHRNWPVCHVSYFEADAYARWAGARLPTEFEWEHAAYQLPVRGQFADELVASDLAVHPTLCSGRVSSTPACMFGGVWEWTSSSYAPYPGYRPLEGAIGEYNGKFMCNQYVLRGGSVATSLDHVRPTYRNFFPPEARWQFSGIRLAK